MDIAVAAALCAVGFGIGCVSGLTPGLHVNNLALLLAAVAPGVGFASPAALGVALVTASVTHTFLDMALVNRYTEDDCVTYQKV
ncbi:MAG: putative membrane protein [Methanobacteriota archaeon]|jgi:putative membrane protein